MFTLSNLTADLKNLPDTEIYNEFHRRVRCSQFNPKRIVVFGPPGSGKGTQSDRITDKLCSCHLATGDILRHEIEAGTDKGKKIKDIMSRGDLVPDELVLDSIKSFLKSDECKKGVVFDGFPRTLFQARKLDEILEDLDEKIDKVISFEIDEKTVIERITGRRIHERSGRVYHMKYKPPKVDGKDDLTGEPLIQREDDTEDTIKKRFANYRKATEACFGYYQKKNLLVSVNANQGIEDVWKIVQQQIFD